MVDSSARFLVQAWYDGAANPLSAAVTRYRGDGSWLGCVVEAAGPFDSMEDVLRRAELAFCTYYGVQLRLFST